MFPDSGQLRHSMGKIARIWPSRLLFVARVSLRKECEEINAKFRTGEFGAPVILVPETADGSQKKI